VATVTTTRRSGAAGFSLIELVVAMFLLLLVLALAGQLLVESGRIFSAAARELRSPEDDLALRWLRTDLKSGVPVEIFNPEWSSEPLVLLEDGRALAWAAEGERLLRAEAPEAGAPPTERILLEDVIAFRWRVPTLGLIEVEIVRRRPEHAPLARVMSAEWRRRGETLEAASLSIASRRSWW
jgi:prepilin-type N-terminal cleavage/methylation domain-containing protein